MIDWTKPIQTKDGEPAELVFTHCSYVKEAYPRWCVINKGTPDERLRSYTEDGRHYSHTSDDNDIVNVPEEKVLGVVNVYKTCIESHDFRGHADDCAEGCNRTHVITIKQLGDKVTAEVEEV